MSTSNPTTEGGLRLFAHAAFLRFWMIRIASVSAAQILAVSLGWQMYELTGSVLQLGLIGLVQFLPRLLFVLLAGQAADHFLRNRVMGLAQVLQALASLGLVLSGPLHFLSPLTLYIAAFLIGTSRTFEMPAGQSLLPHLVPKALFPKAVAMNASAMEFATVVAPALGGALHALGADVVYALATVLGFTAASLSFTLPAPQPAPGPTTGLASFLEGIRYIRSKPDVLGAISLDLFAVLFGGAVALLPVYAKDILHVGPLGLGFLRAAPAAGALTMSLWLAHRSLGTHMGYKLFAAVAVFGVATIVFAFSTHFWLSLAALYVLGLADMISVVIRGAFLQLETPDALRGRVSAVNALFIGASNQLGEFESGFTAALFGTVPAVALGGVGTLIVCALWMRWFPGLLHRNRLESS